MRLQQPHLADVHQWQPAVPRLDGTLQGSVDLQGTYTALTLDAKAQLQQLGIEGIAAQIRGAHAPARHVYHGALDGRASAGHRRNVSMTPQVPKSDAAGSRAARALARPTVPQESHGR